jgi:hypothetical protein
MSGRNTVDICVPVDRTLRQNKLQVRVSVAQILKPAQQELTIIVGRLSAGDACFGANEGPKFWQDQGRGRVKVVQSPEQGGQFSDRPGVLAFRDLRPKRHHPAS